MASQNTKKRQKKLRAFVGNRVSVAVKWFGLPRVLWFDLTLLPATSARSTVELSKLWNRLNAAFLSQSQDVVGWLRVVEAGNKSGRLHIHGLIFAPKAVARRASRAELTRAPNNPRHMTTNGRRVATSFQRAAKKCGFGRMRIGPVNKNAAAVSVYLSGSFRADVFNWHPHLLGAHRFRMSRKLQSSLAGIARRGRLLI